MNRIYYTTTLPYVNADPHIGFALEIIHADIVARARELSGNEIFFNTGTDEHGAKIYEAAEKAGRDTQRYVDYYAEKFRDLQGILGLRKNIHFIRTSEEKHIRAAQEFWKRCYANGDIYKKNYQIKYCVGCELEKTDSELIDGFCPIHPGKPLQIIDEENYFFKFSKYGQKLLDLYAANPDFVNPSYRLNEMKSLIKEKGLEDFSISRLASKMPWGVPVPGDEEHVMYVWFDALVSYISTLDWPEKGNFEKWWTQTGGVIQFAGKDQVRQQAAMWQAMLMSAGLPPSKQIIIHGFIMSNGQKMSKSIGNVIDPLVIVSEYGTETLRYYLARHIHPFEDSDFTMDRFKEAYNADLANGLGNLVSRLMKMAVSYDVSYTLPKYADWSEVPGSKDIVLKLSRYEINEAIKSVFDAVTMLDKKIQETEPFKLVKTDSEKAKAIIAELIVKLADIAELLKPFMPETALKISELIVAKKSPETPLFLRK